MTDARLHRWLEAVDEPLAPAAEFAASLYDAVGEELGFGPAKPLATTPRWRRRRPRRYDLLLVAALVVAGSVGILLASGTVRVQESAPRTDLLALVHSKGALRVAVRPDHPEIYSAGFDVDVATALGTHMNLKAEIVIEDVQSMLDPNSETWDAALPSVASWSVPTATFLVSDPYYSWPHRLVVLDSSTATDVSEVAGKAVCAVAGDAGAAWLRGAYPATVGPEITSNVVERASDDACLSQLESGAVTAIVTARLSDADLDVRAGIRVIGGPDPEPRPVVVHRQRGNSPDPGDFLAAIGDAVRAMHADGTLTRMSQNRFGGADLTEP
jgi:ABC-type amino acid transport substrate-binding protein